MKNLRKSDILFLCLLGLFSFFYPISEADLSFDEVTSLKIVDRNGYLLREVLSVQQGKGHWTLLSDISKHAVDAAITAEDKRFFDHKGVDPLALARALQQNITSGKVISGGSTVTQQVVRNLYHFPRNVFFKAVEMWYAVRLEYTLPKVKILEHYFNRIPYGNQTFGIEAAARLYLGKSAKELTWAEASFLTALPKSPTQYNPYKNFRSAKQRQIFIINKLFDARIITPEEKERALSETIILFPKSNTFHAPHFCEYILQNKPFSGDRIQTTLDLALQAEVEKIIKGHIAQLQSENVTNAAVIVISNKTGDILALAGSSDYFDERHDGQFNAVFSKRQPGSALKPFTYAAAMTKGLTPSSVIPDIETMILSKKAQFTPQNYDNRFHGPVRARIALACSYNVSAVRVLQDIGVETLLSTLHQCGIASLTEPPEFYGHGLTLGNGEVTLFELSRAYSILANSGRWTEPRFVIDQPARVISDHIFSPQVSFLITNILSDNSARTPSFGFDSPLSMPFPCAVKTGTSSDFRDNMTMGYTVDYTVGVWVGNFDNAPMRQISGVTGAGPIFHDIMSFLYKDRIPDNFSIPPGIRKANVCAFSGARPHQGCPAIIQEFFIDGTEPVKICDFHQPDGRLRVDALMPVYQKWLESYSMDARKTAGEPTSQTVFKIIQPRNNAVYKIDPSLRKDYQSIYFEAMAPPDVRKLRWNLNGQWMQTDEYSRKILWNLKPGNYQLKAEGNTAGGKVYLDVINFEVLP